jgi:hypothetical protein
VRSIDAKRLTKNPRFVSATRVSRIQTIVFDLTDIEDRSVAMWQMRHARSPTAILPWFNRE